ncbi:MAG: N-acetylmuramoyl-L-alanine amidase [Siculibacillus sp.]|nr:N-acetylmuramoyl-L-alanine amidase [Siculibacillus sp.]
MTETPEAEAFEPDTSLVDEVRPSPNHGERRGRFLHAPPDILLLHYTSMPDGRGLSGAERAIRWLTMPVSEVSAHYVVDEDGRITQLVPELRRAWHAGRGAWGEDDDVNSASIGIEIVNPGHWWDMALTPDRDPDAPVEVHPGYRPFPEAQIAAVIALAHDIVARNGIPADRVLAHSDIAPGRKRDPGELFPWEKLAKAGVGLWVPPVEVAEGRVLAAGETSPLVAALQAMLRFFGYGLEVTGVFDVATTAVVEAFQRHFRPSRVDGVADPGTMATLRALLEAREAREAIA